jgi:16S rRNA (cytosine1402-N4)-methyltransferase
VDGCARQRGATAFVAQVISSMRSREHEPVLVAEVVRLLAVAPGQVVVDGTVGLGGHAAVLAPLLSPGGVYLGVDVDGQMLERARQLLADAPAEIIRLIQASYTDLPEVLEREGLTRVDHVLLDLGINSAQLDDSERGFSFDRDGPLDMRFDRSDQTRALDIINSASEEELADMFYNYGQESASRRIARRICQVRHAGRITTTKALAAAVESSGIPGGKTHPATRVFQALRIAVNGELRNLETFLEQVTDLIRPGGKLAVISFHSLEDGLVKRFLREAKQAGTFRELTKRPVIAEPAERGRNPRSRSAKLRVAERL